jgi:hypothetical protein
VRVRLRTLLTSGDTEPGDRPRRGGIPRAGTAGRICGKYAAKTIIAVDTASSAITGEASAHRLPRGGRAPVCHGSGTLVGVSEDDVRGSVGSSVLL